MSTSTATLHNDSGNNAADSQPVQDHSTRPDGTINRTPPNSAIVLIPVNSTNWQPTGLKSMPGEHTLKFPLEEAERLALSLNRRLIQDRQRGKWYLVAYTVSGGFVVMCVPVSDNWQPADEYDVPPLHSEGLTNTEARRTVSAINRATMMNCRTIQKWAVHVKPPQRQSVALSEDEQRILDTLNERFNGKVEVVDDGCTIRFVLNRYYLGEFSKHGYDEPSGAFRRLAGMLLDAANELEGKAGPEMTHLQPLYHDFTVEGFEGVHIMVDASNMPSESNVHDAERLARQFMLSLSR